ncbi:DUF1254 domain-containing protein [Corallococcus sp. bb12-1]|uniref:DUF1254 domain-containing protein n=1 Tax=Corallococcus sp. bb12-1 TaxID=2996784 RepID=UPI002270CF4A|nr:DUF1254 domain-containing protein [Corallococcus sp. bb12-1]MCY1047105.1 DUF1254 domain-containing protein [Corallococcus sp. bb12-1]
MQQQPEAVGEASRAVEGVSLQEAREISRDAFIYAYPMLYNYKTLYTNTQDTLASGYTGGFQRFRHYARVFTPQDTDIVTPNNDTPYSMAWLDLRREPLVLRLPEVAKDRYNVFQFYDLFLQNFAYLGVRTTGFKSGRYLIAGPGWDGVVPSDMDGVVRAETELVGILGRTSLSGVEDLPHLRELQKQYVLTPLSEFAGRPPPPPVPQGVFPPWEEARALSSRFIGYVNFLFQFIPPVAAERALMERFARIGMGAGRVFAPEELPREWVEALEAGAEDGLQAIEEAEARTTSSLGLFGTRASMGPDYVLKRAVGARMGIYGNSAEEAVYGGTHQDAQGQPLTGEKSYVLRFNKGGLPPVKFFWSLTLYRLPERELVENPLDRYALGDRTPGLKYGADGSLSLFIQREEPTAPEQRANWLPAPEGPFTLIYRFYGPDERVQKGQWTLPPVRALDA